ncbi:hypothetical protein NDU88_004140 [Pleurodeles waltl]|uniref:Uncharacterized protein n=1 Tax=Pleurodeles waltl TaxID=8319 RepID=A0AAV7KXH7_PLEWA|nr:hypothetical protein NDU88_004140 [Pleurodeles waltl]
MSPRGDPGAVARPSRLEREQVLQLTGGCPAHWDPLRDGQGCKETLRGALRNANSLLSGRDGPFLKFPSGAAPRNGDALAAVAASLLQWRIGGTRRQRQRAWSCGPSTRAGLRRAVGGVACGAAACQVRGVQRGPDRGSGRTAVPPRLHWATAGLLWWGRALRSAAW